MSVYENETLGCNEDDLGPKRDSLYVVVPIILVYVVIFVSGTVGNISTCIVIARNKSMHTATNYYLFSLAISDLVLLVAGLPQEIYLIWYRYPYVFGGTFCFLRGLLAETSGNATVLTITAFTVERYLAICHPFLSHTMSKLSRAVKLILLIWILAVGLAVPLAMPLQIVGEERGCPQCTVIDTVIEKAFEVSTFVFFVAPMTLITVLYALIGLRLRSSRMSKKRIGTTAVRSQSKSSRKVVKMLIAVVVAFFICWAPFHVQRLYTYYHQHLDNYEQTQFHLKIYEVVTYVSGILYYVSATINPILYNIMSVKFREAFKETFSRCCRFGRLHHGRPQRSYSVLSKSNARGPDSTDSGSHDPTVQTNASSLTHKNSADSFNTAAIQAAAGKRPQLRSSLRDRNAKEEDRRTRGAPADLRLASPLPSPTLHNTPPSYLTVHVGTGSSTALTRFLQFFHCVAKRTLDDGKRLSSYYSTPLREPNIPELERASKTIEKGESAGRGRFHSSCISNSSLRDIEMGAIEDELTAYMKEIRKRELCS